MTVVEFRSIQGEQEASGGGGGYTVADQGSVDDFVAGATDEILACRDGNHAFPPRSRSQMVFTEMDGDGLYCRRVECRSCQCVDKVEKWEPVGRGRTVRWHFIGSALSYKTGPNGERYVMKTGMGRALKKQIREAMATMALQGQTPASIKKELMKRIAAEE